MATVPSPRTWTVGELLSAAKLNTDVRDAINFLLTPILAILRRSANQTITNGTHTVINWDVEDIDRDNGHSTSTNTSRYTAQTAGRYLLIGQLTFSHAGNNSGYCEGYFKKNGSSSTFQSRQEVPFNGNGADHAVNLSGHMQLSVGDYVELNTYAYDTTSSQQTVKLSNQDPRFEVRWVST